MIEIIVGDINNSTKYPLLTESTKIKNNQSYFTCLADFSNKKKFIEKLSQADKIIYLSPKEWSNEQLHKETLKCLSFVEIFNNKIVSNFENKSDTITQMLELKDKRKTNNRQLWIAGCSFSEAVGVQDDQKYGTILADRLSLSVSFLAYRGTSNSWSKDQILRSDIRKNDILVWQLTFPNRLTYFFDDEIIHVYPEVFRQIPNLVDIMDPRRLFEQTILYDSITSIMQVVNFCKMNSIDLYIFGVAYNPSKYLTNLQNFIPITSPGGYIKDHYKDIGSDNIHPGPLTHQWYADIIFNKIKHNGIY
jgi:hypothetical protein